MEYDLNQLHDPSRFQRLVNDILTARFGEDARLTPLRGPDGGSDGETAPNNPYMEFLVQDGSAPTSDALVEPPRPGRYLFQDKYHVTKDASIRSLRALVLREFKNTLTNDVLSRADRSDVNYFFLVTNVTSSRACLSDLDDIRKSVPEDRRNTLHVDIWWGERLTSFLDWAPSLWPTFPELFPGGVAPVISQASTDGAKGTARTLRLAITDHYRGDLDVKFQQLNLTHSLHRVFVDLEAELSTKDLYLISHSKARPTPSVQRRLARVHGSQTRLLSAIRTLVDDKLAIRRLLLEGGPGQGKSTLTQMAAQVYRERLLNTSPCPFAAPYSNIPLLPRIPFRIELREFAKWIAENSSGTLEQYLASGISRASGNAPFGVSELHAALDNGAAILFLDGLDEIGQDSQRDAVLNEVMSTIDRLESGLDVDLRVVLTTRPPGVAGRRALLTGFAPAMLKPMRTERVDDYVGRWLSIQVKSAGERRRIRAQFESYRAEEHVTALSQNPMQLAVLLHFIALKGAAFPDHRAGLYQQYFDVVLDRDVEKSPALAKVRQLMVGLHAFLGFQLHGSAEVENADRTLHRRRVLELSESWIQRWGDTDASVEELFKLGQERFGLVMELSGDGENVRYGFPVQPIQEYFAAEYISNYWPSDDQEDSHAIFGRLVNRQYWREVALFFAGLRRLDEKADLILIARQEDKHRKQRRSENGRLLVLQLMQERVLTNPRRVSESAIDYILELFDPEVLRFQRYPMPILDAACALAKEFKPKALAPLLMEGACKAAEGRDHMAVSILHQAAAKRLSSSDYVRLATRHTDLEETTKASVYLSCVYPQQELLAKLAGDSTWWTGPARNAWADKLWESARFYRFIADLPISDTVHRRLLIRFCADDGPPARYGDGGISIRGSKTLAVWKLHQASEKIGADLDYYDLQGGRASPKSGAKAGGYTATSRDEDIVYGGLTGVLEMGVRELTATADGLASALGDGDLGRAREGLRAYVGALIEQSRATGLVGWLACRCAADLLQARHAARLADGADQYFGELREAVGAFYAVPGARSMGRQGEFAERRFYWPYSTPPNVRVESGQDPVGMNEVITGFLRGEPKAESIMANAWFGELPIPASVLRSIVEMAGEQLEGALRFLGTKEIAGWDWGEPLRVQETQRILKICRSTEEQEVLRGAGTVLANAAFGGIAKADEIARLLRTVPDGALVRRLFDSYRDPMHAVRTKVAGRMWQLAEDVARCVLNDPDGYPFSVVSGASEFLGETESRKSVALFDECPRFMQHRDQGEKF